MKFYSLIILFVVQIGFGQTVTLKETTSLDANSFIGIDSYKNTYFIRDMVLHKTGKDGKFQYTNFQLGEITSVDIINPLSIVVFYRDTNSVVLLDNKLAEIQKFNFNTSQEFVNVSAARNAGNNRLWLFNADTQQIELFDYFNKVKVTISQPFSEELKVSTSSFNYFYAVTDSNVITFNPYGGIVTTRFVGGFDIVDQHNEAIIGFKDNGVYYSSKKSSEFVKIDTPEITIKDLQLTQDFLYLYDGNNIHTFSITQPKK